MDRAQVAALIDYMTGTRTVAANPENGEEFGPLYSPELRAFLVARLGDMTPYCGFSAVTREKAHGRALAAFLREAAEAIDRECAP